MNAHSKIQIAAFDGSSVKPRAIPQSIDGILDEAYRDRQARIARLSHEEDEACRSAVERIGERQQGKSERWGKTA